MIALDAWLRAGRKSKAAALREAGYGGSIVHQPHKVFESPAVLYELEMRGLDSRGIRNNLQEADIEEIESAPVISFNFSGITKKQLQWLKEELTKGSDPLQFSNPRKTEEIEIHSHTAKGDGIDIFNITEKHLYYRPNYSSM